MQRVAVRAPGVRSLVVCVVVTLVGVGVLSPYTLLTTLFDGLTALAVVVPACLAGLWGVPLLAPGPLPLRWHVVLGAAFGLGAQSLLLLAAGCAGLLHRPLWMALALLMAAAGLIRVRWLLRHFRDEGTLSALPTRLGAPHPEAVGRISLRLAVYSPMFACVPFIVIALMAASQAPGMLWREEGFGYDVLEYHLQVPREYHAAGRITYLPHNVYANFPMAVEMHYLLAMIYTHGAYDAGVAAHFLHLIFGVLTVAAVWTAARDWSRCAAAVAAGLCGSAFWLAWLSALAYVENGLLFFSAAAMGLVLRTLHPGTPPEKAAHPAVDRRTFAGAGVLAGFACGCKYTAVPMVAVALALAVVAGGGCSLRRRAGGGGVLLLAAAAAFAPWMVKNTVCTGNPVFPLANGFFGAFPEGWGVEQQARWQAGHAPDETQRVAAGALTALWQRTLADADQRFGPVLMLTAGVAAVCLLGDRRARVLTVVLAIQIVVWICATHHYARFAVVLLVPMALLSGLLAHRLAHIRSALRGAAGALVVLGACWNFSFALARMQEEWPGHVPPEAIVNGLVPGYEHYGFVNRELPDSARLLLVGEARAYYFTRPVRAFVVFNRNPFAEMVHEAESYDAVGDWLRTTGFTHVLVHWGEVARLLHTYGFSEDINPMLMDALQTAGVLREVQRYGADTASVPMVVIYEVTREQP